MSACDECGREEGHFLNCGSIPKPPTRSPVRRPKKETEEDE